MRLLMFSILYIKKGFVGCSDLCRAANRSLRSSESGGCAAGSERSAGGRQGASGIDRCDGMRRRLTEPPCGYYFENVWQCGHHS